MAKRSTRSGAQKSKESSFSFLRVNRSLPIYKRWQLYATALIFGGVGSAVLLFANAATTTCAQVGSATNSTMKLCANLGSNNSLTGVASYTGGKGSYRLSTATVITYQCAPTTGMCSELSRNSTIKKPNLFVPSKATVTTTSATVIAGNSYKACVDFRDSTGWEQTAFCTEPTGTTGASSISVISTTSQSAPGCGGQTVPAKADGTEWQCAFSDEFNGTEIDRSKWVPMRTDQYGWYTGYPVSACYKDSPNNISVSGGYLSLVLRKEPEPFICQGMPADRNTTQYTAASVSTWSKFSQQYGRFEIRAKIPADRTKGLQETLWLWPNDAKKYGNEREASGEIDIAEFYSAIPDYNVPYLHYLYDKTTRNPETDTNIVTLGSPNPANAAYNRNYNNCKINQSDFNTYTAVWSSGRIEIYVNGNPCVINNYTSTVGAVPAPFDQPFYVVLTQAIGIYAGYDNSFDPNNPPRLPAVTQVDYVRAWK